MDMDIKAVVQAFDIKDLPVLPIFMVYLWICSVYKYKVFGYVCGRSLRTKIYCRRPSHDEIGDWRIC